MKSYICYFFVLNDKDLRICSFTDNGHVEDILTGTDTISGYKFFSAK